MIVQCVKCSKYYDDEWRITSCPHYAFLANQGDNTFRRNDSAYLDDAPPPDENALRGDSR